MARIAGGAGETLWLGLEAWRWMFIAMIVPAVLYGAFAFTIPGSPRYLIAHHHTPEARRILSALLGEKGLDIKIETISRSLAHEKPAT